MLEGGRRTKWEMEVDRVVVLLSVDGAPPANALKLVKVLDQFRCPQYILSHRYSRLEYSEYPNNTKIQPKMNAIK